MMRQSLSTAVDVHDGWLTFLPPGTSTAEAGRDWSEFRDAMERMKQLEVCDEYSSDDSAGCLGD